MIARMLKLHHNAVNKLSKLKVNAEKEGEYRVAKRIHAVLLNHHGHTSGSISQLLNSPRSRVSEWLKNYEELGYEGLLEGYRSGRPNGLDEKQKQILCDIIDSEPIAYGYLSGVWTSPMIKKVIEEEFLISVLLQKNFDVSQVVRVY